MKDQLEQELESLFGGLGWHHYSELTRKDNQKECYWCKGNEEKRALVNIWGSVYSVGACDKCYDENHGKSSDSL